MTTGKTTALTRETFVSKGMSLLFSTLSRLVIAFLLRSKCLLISWLHEFRKSAVILELKKIKEYIKAVYCHPDYLTYMQSTSCEMLGWMKHKLESRLPGEISTTSDTQMTPPLWEKVKSLFSSSLFSAIRVVSLAFMRLLIFLLAILIPACASSSPSFHMMYSAYKLNKQGDNIQP